MAAALHLARLATPEGYRRHFMDAVLWKPFVRAVCQEHGWTCEQVRPGRAGTFPTFLVDEQRVVKFFGPLFGGPACFLVEREAAGMVAEASFPTARMLAGGRLEAEPRWSYLVFDFIPGVSIGEIYSQLSQEDQLGLARRMGAWVKQMHRAAVPTGSYLPRLDQATMQHWFDARWPEEHKKWPDHLAGEVRDYLEENAAFVQSNASHFSHADLTQDHLLGVLVDGRWQTRALIDFGDAMLGNLYYELAALHLDLFDCDRRLLAAFLDEYGLSPDPDFPRRAMTTSLLHQFDVYGHLFAWKPQLCAAPCLAGLADELWKV